VPTSIISWPAGRLRTSPALIPLDWPLSWRLDRPRVGLLLTVFFLAIPLIAIIQVDHSAHAKLPSHVSHKVGSDCGVARTVC
jgi:hypothetical protein